jgi:prephenate dehydratase
MAVRCRDARCRQFSGNYIRFTRFAKANEYCVFGPEGSFSHLAARLHFGASSNFFPQQGLHVFSMKWKKGRRMGSRACENSLEGSVNVTLDRLVLTPLKIQAEMYLRISQCLISSAKNLKNIKKSIRIRRTRAVSGLAQVPLAKCRAG